MLSMWFITKRTIKTVFWKPSFFYKMRSQNAWNAISGIQILKFSRAFATSPPPPIFRKVSATALATVPPKRTKGRGFNSHRGQANILACQVWTHSEQHHKHIWKNSFTSFRHCREQWKQWKFVFSSGNSNFRVSRQPLLAVFIVFCSVRIIWN
jgi:hypothetical protein